MCEDSEAREARASAPCLPEEFAECGRHCKDLGKKYGICVSYGACVCNLAPCSVYDIDWDFCKQECKSVNNTDTFYCSEDGQCICGGTGEGVGLCGPDDTSGSQCLKDCKRRRFFTSYCDNKQKPMKCVCLRADDMVPCGKGDPSENLCKIQCFERGITDYHSCSGGVCTCKRGLTLCGLEDVSGAQCDAECKKNNFVGSFCDESVSPVKCVCLTKSDMVACGKGDRSEALCKQECQKQELLHHKCLNGKCQCTNESSPNVDSKLCGADDLTGRKCHADCKKRGFYTAYCDDKKSPSECVCLKEADMVPCGKGDPSQQLCRMQCYKMGVKKFYRCDGTTCKCSKNSSGCSEKDSEICARHCRELGMPEGVCDTSGVCLCGL